MESGHGGFWRSSDQRGGNGGRRVGHGHDHGLKVETERVRALNYRA